MRKRAANIIDLVFKNLLFVHVPSVICTDLYKSLMLMFECFTKTSETQNTFKVSPFTRDNIKVYILPINCYCYIMYISKKCIYKKADPKVNR